MSASNASWRPDPDGEHEYRYWDGETWTDHVSNAGTVTSSPRRPPSDGDNEAQNPPQPDSAVDRESDGSDGEKIGTGDDQRDGDRPRNDGDTDGREGEEVGTGDDQREAGLFGSNTGANMAVAAAGELIGTFLLVFAGTAVAVAATLSEPTAGAAYDSLAVALAFGLTLASVVAALGHVSGAHVNPAVTVGLAVTGRFPWSFVPAYLAAQIAGAVTGSLATWVTFGSRARDVANLAATQPAPGVTDPRALIVEALVTFVLVFTVVSVATDKRAAPAAAPLAVGFALTAGVLIAGPVTGGAVNPARALGPMLVSGELSSFWLYIAGPVAGGVIAALVYDRFIAKGATPS